MFGVLGSGAGLLIELGGTDKIRDLFLKNVYTGKWAATMQLSETNAGSDVGALTTTATPNGDGTYSLKGNKIFISNGDHDLTENIIHPILARIEGAPAGTRGISLFLVPKYWVNDDGSIGDFNHISCTGIEDKLGLHGSPTCSMSLGEKGMCRGMLLGEENRGMNLMFHMMNNVRLEVGMQALSYASAAYLYAVDFAKERLQGRSPEEKDPSQQVPIIRHADVRRMLMEMKADVEGIRSFVYYITYCFDMISSSEDGDEGEYFQGIIDFMTPILKSFASEKGFDTCVKSMQVFGGYGYTREYPIEQLVRDCKITSIYEGTNGIQAMDLVGRKLDMKDGKVFEDIITEIRGTTAIAMESRQLVKLAEKLEAAVQSYEKTKDLMTAWMSSTESETVMAHAHPFQMVSGEIIVAWMLLWRASIAAARLEEICGETKGEERAERIAAHKAGDFYEGQVATATYYINTVLPVTLGKMSSIISGDTSILQISDNAFSS